jgi:hypothetical protein
VQSSTLSRLKSGKKAPVQYAFPALLIGMAARPIIKMEPSNEAIERQKHAAHLCSTKVSVERIFHFRQSSLARIR